MWVGSPSGLWHVTYNHVATNVCFSAVVMSEYGNWKNRSKKRNRFGGRLDGHFSQPSNFFLHYAVGFVNSVFGKSRRFTSSATCRVIRYRPYVVFR